MNSYNSSTDRQESAGTNALPPLLLFDISAVLAGKTREWQAFSRVGECYLPQVIMDELHFLADRASDRENEHIAREFVRFYPDSGWQLSALLTSHPALKPASGQAMSKRARQALAVAQCAYALSQDYQSKVVVLVANDQPLLQKVQAVGAPNLCGITVGALFQWIHGNRQPIAVNQRLRAMESSASAGGNQPLRQPSVPRAVTTTPTTSKSRQRSQRTKSPQRVGSMYPGTVSQIISGSVALAAVAIAGFFLWGLAQPAKFNQIWNQLGLPQLPNQQPAKPKK